MKVMVILCRLYVYIHTLQGVCLVFSLLYCTVYTLWWCTGRCTCVINPRRASAARVTVLGLSFRLSVCLSVTTFSATTRNKVAKKQYQQVQYHTGLI